MRIDVLTIFPEYLAPLELSLIGRARQTGLLDLVVHDLRDFTHDRHRTVDDTPAGGGAGMVMRPEPWGEALDAVLGDAVLGDAVLGDAVLGDAVIGDAVLGDAVLGDAAPVTTASGDGTTAEGPRVEGSGGVVLIVPSPSGRPFTQALAHELAGRDRLVFACGRYEGIDERVLDHAEGRVEVLRVSLGDYVLNGGEVAVLAIVEAVGRLLPGVVGNAESLVEESHEGGLLEYPVYTKPAAWRGLEVPEVLLSGHHGRIARWRRDERLRRTARRRPDLIAALDPAGLDRGDRAVLETEGWQIVDAAAPADDAVHDARRRFLAPRPAVAD